jgi:hypothetical protein
MQEVTAAVESATDTAPDSGNGSENDNQPPSSTDQKSSEDDSDAKEIAHRQAKTDIRSSMNCLPLSPITLSISILTPNASLASFFIW